MALLTEQNLRDRWVGELATEIGSSQLLSALSVSRSVIRKSIDPYIFADVLKENPDDPERAEEICEAQSKLAYRELLLYVPIQNGGTLHQDRDDTTNSTVTFTDLDKKARERDRLKNDAFELLDPYLTKVVESSLTNSILRSRPVKNRVVF